MNTFAKTEKIDVVLLCGGLGKRIRPALNGRPKVMAEINGRPFLDILIGHISTFGFRRFILCTGYKRDEIKDYYQKKEKSILEILFSEERNMLGTGGAIKNAEPLIENSPFLAMNGDSLCRLNLRKFLDFHLAKNAVASLALAKAADSSDYGAVSLGKSHKIVSFNEKTGAAGDGYINTGVYLFEKEILSLIPPAKNISLEKDFFPGILDPSTQTARMGRAFAQDGRVMPAGIHKHFFGYKTKAAFIDIGTPERYEKAKRLLGV